MQEESPKRLGKEKGGDSARQRLGLTAQYHSIKDPETSSSSFPSTDSPGEAAVMTSPPHHTGRFIDAVPSDQLQIAGEQAESSGLHKGVGNTDPSVSQTNVMNIDESANLQNREVDASTQHLTQVNAERTAI